MDRNGSPVEFGLDGQPVVWEWEDGLRMDASDLAHPVFTRGEYRVTLDAEFPPIAITLGEGPVRTYDAMTSVFDDIEAHALDHLVYQSEGPREALACIMEGQEDGPIRAEYIGEG